MYTSPDATVGRRARCGSSNIARCTSTIDACHKAKPSAYLHRRPPGEEHFTFFSHEALASSRTVLTVEGSASWPPVSRLSAVPCEPSTRLRWRLRFCRLGCTPSVVELPRPVRLFAALPTPQIRPGSSLRKSTPTRLSSLSARLRGYAKSSAGMRPCPAWKDADWLSSLRLYTCACELLSDGCRNAGSVEPVASPTWKPPMGCRVCSALKTCSMQLVPAFLAWAKPTGQSMMRASPGRISASPLPRTSWYERRPARTHAASKNFSRGALYALVINSRTSGRIARGTTIG
mmetsp:Transcript_81159/g.197009  ORF Transcript_81159/g.197009 Transcript_81159/m.197009 type:complete len:289 (-) Transcript_81159:720-1586(-)